MNTEKNIIEISVNDIIPNRFQPRMNFNEEGIKELAESIKQYGIIEPLVVRKFEDKYEIIAGERRYRAALSVGLKTIPAILSEINDEQSAEVALVENVQRKNLSPIEEAKSFKNLLDRGYLTQEQLASKMGLSQSAIANKLRLLNLDEEVQTALLQEQISERHARALLKFENKEEQKEWLKRIIDEKMTVRELEIELKKLDGNDLEEELVPIVNINPDIENIVNHAEDINVIREPHDVASFLIPDSRLAEEQKEIPVIKEETPEKMPNKFFNFLEEESANMNVGDLKEENIFNNTVPLATPVEVLEDTLEITEENKIEKSSTPLNEEVSEDSTPTIESTPNLSENSQGFFASLLTENQQTENPQPESTANFEIKNPITETSSEESGSSDSISPFKSIFTTEETKQEDLSTTTTLEETLPLQEIGNNEETSENNYVIEDNSSTTSSEEGSAHNPRSLLKSIFSSNKKNTKEPENPNQTEDTPIKEENEVISTQNVLENNNVVENTISEVESTPLSIEENNSNESNSPFKSIFFSQGEEIKKEESEEPKATNQIEEIIPMPEEPLIDPLDSIITLEPDYAAKLEEEAGTDLKTAINTVRNTVNDLELRGFNIEIEEADLESDYQINIKIIK